MDVRTIAVVHPDAVPQNRKRAYTVGLYEALEHELPASGEARPKTESYRYLKVEKRGISRYLRRAKAEDAIVYWADETGVSNCEIVERGFSPKGRPPVLPVETKRQRVNMISAVSS